MNVLAQWRTRLQTDGRLWLLGAFCFTYVLPGITRYKAAILFLMLGAVVMRVRREGMGVLRGLINPATAALGVLGLAIVYGCLIAADPLGSFREARTPVFLQMLLVAGVLPPLVAGFAAARVARVVVLSFVASALVLLSIEGARYAQQFAQVGLDISHNWLWNQREFSDPLMLLLPFVLALGASAVSGRARCAFALALGALLLGVLGTHARGSWLAAAVVVVVWAVRARYFKALFALGLAAALAVGGVLSFAPHSMLAEKLRQRDGSERWGGTGTQSAALDLIMQHPIKGQGFGDEAYAASYARAAPNHPRWTYREPIGPHNLLLKLWFSSGLLGVLALVGLYAGIMLQARRVMAAHTGMAREMAFAVFLAFLGTLFVRGFFEATYLNFFGPLVGLLAVLCVPPRERA